MIIIEFLKTGFYELYAICWLLEPSKLGITLDVHIASNYSFIRISRLVSCKLKHVNRRPLQRKIFADIWRAWSLINSWGNALFCMRDILYGPNSKKSVGYRFQPGMMMPYFQDDLKVWCDTSSKSLFKSVYICSLLSTLPPSRQHYVGSGIGSDYINNKIIEKKEERRKKLCYNAYF